MNPLNLLAENPLLIVVIAGFLFAFWPNIVSAVAGLVKDENNDGKPDMDISKIFGSNANCAQKILDAAKCLDKVEDAAMREQLAQAAVKKILEGK